MQERLPWFMAARPSAACAKGGAGAYTDAIQADGADPGGLAGLADGVLAASAFRTSYVPLATQRDFIQSLQVPPPACRQGCGSPQLAAGSQWQDRSHNTAVCKVEVAYMQLQCLGTSRSFW